MKEITFRFDVRPMAHQSVRATKHGFYQPVKIKKFKEAVVLMAKSQLPDGFEIIHKDVPLVLTIIHCFKYRKSEKNPAEQIPKITKPDVTDNLQKGIVDALAGVVYEQDQQFTGCIAFKFWEKEDCIRIKIEEFNMSKYIQLLTF